MSPRRQRARLDDILQSCDAIERYLTADPRLEEGPYFDAVRARIIFIGEAVKHLTAETKASAPHLRWRRISGMRDVAVHEYFDTAHAVVLQTSREDIPELKTAVELMLRGHGLDDEDRRPGR